MKNANVLIFKLRKVHRVIAPYFFIFILIIALTGMLLGSKKIFYQSIYKAVKTDKKEIANDRIRIDSLPIEKMKIDAISFLENYNTACSHSKLDKIEIRISKNQINYIFKNGFVVVFSLTNFQLLEVNKNIFPQLIHLHDGSILENWFSKFPFKQVYTIILGLSLIIFTITGMILWYQYKFIIKK